DSATKQISFDLGSISAGSTGTVTFVVQVVSPLANGTTLPAGATMSATGVTSATANTTNTVTSAPTLSLTETGAPNPIVAGNQLTYTLAFANNGTDVANGATLVAALPTGTTFVSASDSGSFNAGTKRISWTLGTVAAGASGTMTFVVT